MTHTDSLSSAEGCHDRIGDGLQRRRDRALGHGARLFYAEPLEIVRGEGVYLFAADGRRYVDMYNNVPSVGHGNPRVVEAMRSQQLTLNVHSRYLHEGIVSFAERFCALHDPSIESVVISNSGTEANDVAVRMARAVTGRRGVIVTNANYHGSSEMINGFTKAIADPAAYPEVRTFQFPDLYRSEGDAVDEEEICDFYIRSLTAAVDSLVRSGVGVAALLVCPILANEGLPDVPVGFWAKAAEIIRAAGGLIIADEVQSGYGRTGTWWGYRVAGLVPDIVVTGKPMGNGLPLAATAASRETVDRFRMMTRYFNTAASTPLQAAVGTAVLDEIEERNLLINASTLGVELKAALRSLAIKYDWIGDVRGVGLFLGLDIVRDAPRKSPDPERARVLVELLKNRGFLTSVAGAYVNMIKIRPPLVIERRHIDEFLAVLSDVCEVVDARR
ncbi:aspartate aminotransferase family protein [Rhodococcus sp. NPDC060176]|uniref:aspartate aminotransferase family protein n=1 Tax=Rhodococcus sp. NPDC060176 TaxID=3347062 RepID=UPI00364B9908